jgi:hypothetical protein
MDFTRQKLEEVVGAKKFSANSGDTFMERRKARMTAKKQGSRSCPAC